LSFLIPFEEKQAIYELLITAATFLDEGRYLEWADLFVENAEYEMLFKSREIGGVDDYLMKLDKKELANTLRLLTHHVIDTAKRLHVVSNVNAQVNGNSANCLSSFSVYRTTEDGRTSLYAVGRSEDALVKQNNRWLFLKRRVVLDTRLLEVHTHMPLQ